jgi:GH24 family phage-related lysozyme (muramidase)
MLQAALAFMDGVNRDFYRDLTGKWGILAGPTSTLGSTVYKGIADDESISSLDLYLGTCFPLR